MSISYPNSVPLVHRQRSPRSQGFFKDDGCEVSDACLDCPLSRCKHDDRDWYRFWRLRTKQLAMGQAIEREGLTVKSAASRFGVTTRTIQRVRRTCRLARRILTPGDIATFTRLADAGAVREAA